MSGNIMNPINKKGNSMDGNNHTLLLAFGYKSKQMLHISFKIMLAAVALFIASFLILSNSVIAADIESARSGR
jgi:hypothetical protein